MIFNICTSNMYILSEMSSINSTLITTYCNHWELSLIWSHVMPKYVSSSRYHIDKLTWFLSNFHEYECYSVKQFVFTSSILLLARRHPLVLSSKELTFANDIKSLSCLIRLLCMATYLCYSSLYKWNYNWNAKYQVNFVLA